MKFLCDTNIFLQILRDRQFARQCADFLKANMHQSFIGSFGVFSLCIRAHYFQMEQAATQLMFDLIQGGLKIIPIDPTQTFTILMASKGEGLTFDDFLHHKLAKENGLTLVTLDNDFLKIKDKLDIHICQPQDV